MEDYTNIQIDKYLDGLKLTYKKLLTSEKIHQDWQLTREGFEDDTDIPNCISLGKDSGQILKTLEWLVAKVGEITKLISS